MEKTIIIIGAGIAGLAAGCYAQMNGYRSQIFEMHTLPGGLCTAWERGPYVFDGCIHYLYGSAPGQPFHQVWQELGAVQGRRFIQHDELLRVSDSRGQTLIVYANPDRLEQHMTELSPADRGLIRSMCQGIRQFSRFDMTLLQQKPKPLMTPADWGQLGLQMLPYVLPLARWATLSAQELASRFQDPFLRRAVAQMFTWPDIPVMAGLSLLAYLHNGNAGVPLGASLEFARAIERRYLALGSQVHYQAQVEKILTEEAPDGRGKRAVGVRLYDDSLHRADYVISAADGRGTIFDLLDGQFVDRGLKRLYDGHLPMHSQVQVSLGVKRDLSTEPHWVIHLLDEPLTLAGEDRYEIYPGIRADIEVVDEATPLSYERYTGNWQGSSCGWLLTKQTMPMMIRGVRKTLPGLRNFYLAGQWVEPGGSLPLSAMSGRNAIQMICHQDGRPFVATTA
jgi:phytoene dehydrogenase-like protein